MRALHFLAGVLPFGTVLVFTNAEAATINQTVCVRNLDKRMSDGQTVRFWGFTTSCMGMGAGQLPGPAIEVGVYPEGISISPTRSTSRST